MASPSAQPATPGKRAPSSSAMPQSPYHRSPLPEALRTTAFFSIGRHPDEIPLPDLPPSTSHDAGAASSDAAAATAPADGGSIAEPPQDGDDVDHRQRDDEIDDECESEAIEKYIDPRESFYNMVHERAWVQKGASE
eukprot:3193733-Pleurochrysis_carterae.AAC.1